MKRNDKFAWQMGSQHSAEAETLHEETNRTNPSEGREKVKPKQNRILWAGMGVMALMSLFPPWVQTFNYSGPDQWEREVRASSERSVGYSVIFIPPYPEPPNKEMKDFYWNEGIEPYGVRLDISRLLIQWFAVTMLTGGLFLKLAGNNQTKGDS